MQALEAVSGGQSTCIKREVYIRELFFKKKDSEIFFLAIIIPYYRC